MRMALLLAAVAVMLAKLTGLLMWPWFGVWAFFILFALPFMLPTLVKLFLTAAGLVVVAACVIDEMRSDARIRKAAGR